MPGRSSPGQDPFHIEQPNPLQGDHFAYVVFQVLEHAGESDDLDMQMAAVNMLREMFDREPRSMRRVHEALCESEDARHRAIGALTLNAALPHAHTDVIERWGQLMGDPDWRPAHFAGEELDRAMARRALDQVNVRRILSTALALAREVPDDSGGHALWVEDFQVKYDVHD